MVDTAPASQMSLIEPLTGQLPVRYMHRPGYTAPQARNLCLEQASHDLLLLLDDDAVANPEWIREMVGLHERFPEAAVISGDLVHVPADSVYSILIDTIRAHRKALAQVDHERLYLDLPNCLLVRSRLRTHGIRFDEQMAREEDIDLALQVLRKRQKIVLAAEGRVYHHVRPTLRAFLRQRFQNSGNVPRLRAKWRDQRFHFYGARRLSYLAPYRRLVGQFYREKAYWRLAGFVGLVCLSVASYETGSLWHRVVGRVRGMATGPTPMADGVKD